MRFWSGHCSYWLVDRAVVWCAAIVYGENLRCLTVVMIRGAAFLLISSRALPAFPVLSQSGVLLVRLLKRGAILENLTLGARCVLVLP